MNQQLAVELKGVTFAYQAGAPVLEDISIGVRQGEFLGIVGPNGSAKSTLLKVVLGIIRPQRGEVRLFGQPLVQFREWSRIGYVPQKAQSFNSGFPATVREVVAMGRFSTLGLVRGLDQTDWLKVDGALEQVGMAHLGDRLIGQLSGGQQQRVFIARALVSDPALLILDEPTVGVDVEAQEEFYRLLGEINRKLGITLMMVSHDIGVVTGLVTKLCCINKRIYFHGDPEVFTNNPDILFQAYGHGMEIIQHHH